MEPIKQLWTWNCNWWEWDWFYNWPAWSYRAGNNLETKQVENWVCICNALVATAYTFIWDMTAVNPYEEMCFATRDDVADQAKIYYWWVFKFNTWTRASDIIYWFWKMTRVSDTTSYSYWISWTSSWVWKVFRFATDFTSATSVWTWTLWNWRTASPSNNRMPVLSVAWRIIFAWGNTIFEITDTEVITKLVTLPKEVDIVAISKYQYTYKVFYNWKRFANWTTDSYVAYWDWFDIAFSSTVKYEASPIRTVVNDWAYDYTTFWDKYTSDLYYVAWLNRWEPVRTNIEESTNNTRLFWLEWVIREWILYMTWTNKLWVDCLYSYGNYYTWTNNQLVPENSWKTITKINVTERVLYCYINDDVSANLWKIYTKNFFFATQPETTATIYSYPLTWNYWISTDKTIESIHIPYLLYHSSDHIKIYAKKTWSPYVANTSWWVQIADITWATDLAKRWKIIYRSSLVALDLWNFNQLEYKAELIAWSTKSPILWPIKTPYLDNLKQ